MLLQTESFGIFETLTQYGALGVIVLALGSVLWFMLKRQLMSEDLCKNKVDELQKEMTNYIRQDQNHLKEAIENNTKALQELQESILKKKKNEQKK